MIDREVFSDQREHTVVAAGINKLVFSSSFMPKAGPTYWFFFMGELSGTLSAPIDFYVDGVPLNANPVMTEAAEWLPFSFMFPVTYISVFESLIECYTHSLADVSLRNLSLHIIEEAPTDQSVLFATSKSGTETTYQDWESLTITPTGAGNYLIIARAMCLGGQTTDTMMIELTDGTTVWSETRIRSANNSETRSWVAVVEVSGLVAATTYTVKVKALAGTASYSFGEACILAIDRETLDGYHFAESRARVTTTSNSPTYVDGGASLTATPNQNEHLLIFCHANDVGSTGRMVNSQIVEGSVVLAQASTRNTVASGNGDYVFFKILRRTLPNSSQTWKQQYCGSNVVVPLTVGVQDSAIALLQIRPSNGKVNIDGKTSILGKALIR